MELGAAKSLAKPKSMPHHRWGAALQGGLRSYSCLFPGCCGCRAWLSWNRDCIPAPVQSENCLLGKDRGERARTSLSPVNLLRRWLGNALEVSPGPDGMDVDTTCPQKEETHTSTTRPDSGWVGSLFRLPDSSFSLRAEGLIWISSMTGRGGRGYFCRAEDPTERRSIPVANLHQAHF